MIEGAVFQHQHHETLNLSWHLDLTSCGFTAELERNHRQRQTAKQFSPVCGYEFSELTRISMKREQSGAGEDFRCGVSVAANHSSAPGFAELLGPDGQMSRVLVATSRFSLVPGPGVIRFASRTQGRSVRMETLIYARSGCPEPIRSHAVWTANATHPVQCVVRRE